MRAPHDCETNEHGIGKWWFLFRRKVWEIGEVERWGCSGDDLHRVSDGRAGSRKGYWYWK